MFSYQSNQWSHQSKQQSAVFGSAVGLRWIVIDNYLRQTDGGQMARKLKSFAYPISQGQKVNPECKSKVFA